MPIQREKKEYYDKIKNEVMDSDELKLSERYIEYFRSSWRDKNQRGLFDKWEEIENYWDGNVNLPESDNDPASNINIVHSNIEGQVALLVEQNMAIEVSPQGISDIPYSDVVQNILEWTKRKNAMKRKLDIHERRREKFGTGIFRVLFDPKALDGFGLPVIEPCSPAYVFTDPNITDLYKIQEGRFLIEVANKSIQWGKDNPSFIPGRAEAIVPEYHPIEFNYIFGEDEGETDELSRDNYLHMFVWTKAKGKLRLVQMSGCGIILQDSKKEDTFYPDDTYPYFFTPLYYREGSVWAKGDAELLIGIQNLINDIDDQIRINARLSGNPQKLISNSSGIDLEKWTNEPALNIPCNDVNNAYRPIIPPTMPVYPIDRRKYAIEYEIAKVTRFSDQSTGIRQKGVDTATEALALQQAGTAGIGYKKLLLQETLEQVFEYVLKLVKEFYTEEQAFRITETKSGFIWFRGSKLKEIPKQVPASDEYKRKFLEKNPNALIPEYMQLENKETGEKITKDAAFDISVTVGAGMPNNKAFVYTVIKEAFAAGAITLQEYRKLLKEYVALPIDENPEMQQNQQVSPNGTNNNIQNPNIMGMKSGNNPSNPGAMGNMQIGGMPV